jgi:hypothetical protein
MKCFYKFTVDSSIKLERQMEFMSDGMKFILECPNSRFSRLTIEVSGVHFSDYPKTVLPGNGEHLGLIFPKDPWLKRVQAEARLIKATLSLWGVLDIATESPEISWEPESDEEIKNTNIFGLKKSIVSLREIEPVSISNDMLIRSILSRDGFREFEIPLEFYRRGLDDYGSEHYIESIYDFYFVLEYLWGNGKFKKNDIVREFISSEDATLAINLAIKPFESAMHDRHLDKEYCNASYLNKDANKIFEHIVDLRGYLHHQSSRRKYNWNPGFQSEYEIDATFLFWVTHFAVSKISTRLLFQKAEIDRFMSTPIFNADGQKIVWLPKSN